MNSDKNPSHRGVTFNPRFDFIQQRATYLPDDDRHLYAVEPPKYRFNVIGVGANGQEHLKLTMLEGRATVHGVFDPNPRSVAAAQKIHAHFSPPDQLVVYDSLAAACTDPAVDGLIISTPNYTHLAVVQQAVQSGKHILLEKPMATTLPDARAIAELAADYPAVFQVGLQYRYKATYAEAIYEALTRRSVGNIKTISIAEHRLPFLDKVNQWNKFSQYSGGTLVEKCCHYFDLMNLFARSKPASVFATGSQAVNFVDFEYNGQTSDILDNAFVTVTYQNGVRAGFNLCMFAPMFHEELVLCGDAGRLKTTETVDFLAGPPAKNHLEILRGENGPSRVTSPHYPAFVEQSGHLGSSYYEHINFVDNIEGRPTNAATAQEGFWSIVVGVAAEESVKTGQVVQIAELLNR
ncbi:MAG: gfo/Idh/MocA family oxidoreductase [Chloroflexi bacterium]|nr:MAG: gfo/Idh/MocA family oxidoreductase [Chloroflexota bacterium]